MVAKRAQGAAAGRGPAAQFFSGAPEAEVIPLRRRSSERATLSVAVVDTSYDSFLQTRRCLQKVGGSRFYITYADCLEAGYELLRDKVFDVALIASDLHDRSGLELIRRLGGRAAATPLILLADGGDADFDAEALGAGAIEHLDKNDLAGGLLERTIRYARHTHALEAKLRAALQGMSEANAAKSEFLARMSHDLRTPLNAILGFSEVLRDQMYGEMGSTKYVEYAGHIHDSGRHLLTLINGILDLSKIEAGQLELSPEPLDVGEVVPECLRLVELEGRRKDLRFSARVEPDLPLLTADRRGVKQMLVNLLSNAVKYTPVGGQIDIEARLRGHELCIAVRDNGIGIAPEDIEAVLQPFGQGRQPIEARREGCGLGLSIVKSLIEMHGGRIEIEGGLERGTAVGLIFPRERLGGPR